MHTRLLGRTLFVVRRVRLKPNNEGVSLVGSRGLPDCVSALSSSSHWLFQLALSFAETFVMQNNVLNNSAKANLDRFNLTGIVNVD